MPKRGARQFKSLQKDGFTGCQIEVSVLPEDKTSGASVAKTISIRNFNKLLAYEAIKKRNVRAIILLVSFSEKGLEQLIDHAFRGKPLDWFAEKVVHYSKMMSGFIMRFRLHLRICYFWLGFDWLLFIANSKDIPSCKTELLQILQPLVFIDWFLSFRFIFIKCH